MECYSKLTGKLVNPYATCPICRGVYKDCGHLIVRFTLEYSLARLGIDVNPKKIIPKDLVFKVVGDKPPFEWVTKGQY